MAISQKKIRQFKCNSCGGQLELQNPRTKFVACPYCGSVADASSDAYVVLTKNANPAQFPPRSFLKLGMTGTFNGMLYKIIGRSSWKSDYKEYWSEEGETGYSDEVWTFDEWLLIGEDATYLSIIEDSYGFHFSYSIIPRFPSISFNTSTNCFLDNSKKRVDEYGYSTIMYFEGESTYLVVPGNYVGFSQYSIGNWAYISEWRYDNKKKIKEVEFFKETSVAKNIILEAFKDDSSVKEVFDKLEQKAKVRKINKRIFLFAGLFNFILGIILAIALGNDNSPVLTEEFKLDSSFYSLKSHDTIAEISMNSLQKINITPDDKTININFVPTCPRDSFEAMFSLSFIDEKNDTIFKKSEFVYHYDKIGEDKEAHTEGSMYDYFNTENITGTLTPCFSVNIPKRIKVADISSVGASLKIYKYGKNYNVGSFIFIGIILMVISLFIRKPKL